MNTYTLVVPFLADGEEFARGVEVGMLYTRMKCGHEDEIKDCFLRENQEQILLLANRLGWRVLTIRTYDESWFWCWMARTEE